MESDVLKYGWLIVLTLGQIILFFVKNLGGKDNPSKYGERIKGVEVKVEEIEKDFETFKKENREDHQKFLDKLNKKKRD